MPFYGNTKVDKIKQGESNFSLFFIFIVMNLNENIQRIKSMMGLVTEENNDLKKLYTIQVSSPVESKNSIGVLVDLVFDENGRNTSASNLKWFPKSLCTIERIEPVDSTKDLPTYFLTAPKWIIDKNINK